MIKRLFIFIPILILACTGIPENISPITGFDVDQGGGPNNLDNVLSSESA